MFKQVLDSVPIKDCKSLAEKGHCFKTLIWEYAVSNPLQILSLVDKLSFDLMWNIKTKGFVLCLEFRT